MKNGIKIRQDTLFILKETAVQTCSDILDTVKATKEKTTANHNVYKQMTPVANRYLQQENNATVAHKHIKARITGGMTWSCNGSLSPQIPMKSNRNSKTLKKQQTSSCIESPRAAPRWLWILQIGWRL